MRKSPILPIIILAFLVLVSAHSVDAGKKRGPSMDTKKYIELQRKEDIRIMTIFALLPLAAVIGLIELCRRTKVNPFRPFTDAFQRKSAVSSARRIVEMLSPVTSGEGLERINPDECEEITMKLARGPYSEEIVRDLPGFGVAAAFRKEKPDYTMYLCYTYRHFLFAMLSKTAVHPDNMLIKRIDDPKGASLEVGMDLNLLVKPLVVTDTYTKIPEAVKEIVTRNYGVYPMTRDLHAIFVGKGGFCVIARETGNVMDVDNLFKFSRDLGNLLEEENLKYET